MNYYCEIDDRERIEKKTPINHFYCFFCEVFSPPSPKNVTSGGLGWATPVRSDLTMLQLRLNQRGQAREARECQQGEKYAAPVLQ